MFESAYRQGRLRALVDCGIKTANVVEFLDDVLPDIIAATASGAVSSAQGQNPFVGAVAGGLLGGGMSAGAKLTPGHVAPVIDTINDKITPLVVEQVAPHYYYDTESENV